MAYEAGFEALVNVEKEKKVQAGGEQMTLQFGSGFGNTDA